MCVRIVVYSSGKTGKVMCVRIVVYSSGQTGKVMCVCIVVKSSDSNYLQVSRRMRSCQP
jgi:hypothetical protein